MVNFYVGRAKILKVYLLRLHLCHPSTFYYQLAYKRIEYEDLCPVYLIDKPKCLPISLLFLLNE